MTDHRSKLTLLEAIFQALSHEPLTPTQLRRKIGMEHGALTDYLEVIRFIQQQPRLITQTHGRIEILSLTESPITVTPLKKQSGPKIPPMKPNAPTDSFLSEKDAIGIFRQEFSTVLKTLKWKISAEKLEDVLKFLYRYWAQLDWTTHPPKTFPADSLKKILRYLTPLPEDVGEEEKTELEACLQTCWDEFAP
jgi:hypothetical protein